jgi:hypothetical protein
MRKNSDRLLSVAALSIATAAVAALVVVIVTLPSPGITASPGQPAVSTTSPFRSPSPSPRAVTTIPSPSAAGQLTGLRDGSKVAFNQPVNGVVTGLPRRDDAWVVIEPVSAPAFWPQPGPLALLPTGAFRASVYFGASAAQDARDQFIVLLVAAPPAASSRFQAFVASNPSQGIPRLPPGLLTLSQVTVTRR